MMDEQAVATARAYDSAAVDFAERTRERSAMAAEFFERFLAQLHPNSLVGDLGCGPGHDLGRMLEAGHRTLGLDRSPGLLALCPSESLAVRADLKSVPVSDGSLDAIWSSAALLHVNRSDVASTFAEWNRVLAPKGTVAFATSLGGDEGWEVVPATRTRVPENAQGHQRWFVHHTKQHLLDAAAAIRWTVISSTVRTSTRDWLQVLATTANQHGSCGQQ